MNQDTPVQERCESSRRARGTFTARKAGLVKAVTGIVVLLSFVACAAQERPPAPSASMSPDRLFSPQQLDQILAPIALYPDALIAQILTAATYPLEVVEADRWLQVPANAALKG